MIVICGVKFHDGPIADAVTGVIDDCLTDPLTTRCVSATGAHGVVNFNRNADFRSVLDKFHLNLPDGMPIVWLARIKGAARVERCYGPRFFELLMRASARRPIRHFLCGGNYGIAERLRMVCLEEFQNRNVVGCFTPPFEEMTDLEMMSLADEISSSESDVVWIGLSTPKQEKFALRLSRFAKAKYIITIGAAFDFHTGMVRQAPFWMQRNGLEWLFRLMMEPRRLLRRYIEVVPMFLYYGFVDVFTYWLNNRRANEAR